MHESAETPLAPAGLGSAGIASPARSHLLGTIARAAIGPYSARSGDRGVVVWVVPAEGGGGSEMVAVPFGSDGAPLGAARVVASVPRETTSLVVRPTGLAGGGWWVVWSAILDRGESLSVLELGPDATPKGPAVDLERTSDHVTWADVVAGDGGSLGLWAEQTAAGDANLLAARIGSDGKPEGMPVRVARKLRGWAVVGTEGGAGVALVTREKGAAAGTLSWMRVDQAGNPRGPVVGISKEPTVSGDVDVVACPEGWLLAWTDRTGEDPQVMLAVVDSAGRVTGPSRAMNALGGSALVALASGRAGEALAWEEPHGRARPWRALHVARVTTAGGVDAKSVASFSVVARAPAELVDTSDGFGFLASPMPACSPHCAGDPVAVPVFARLDAGLSVLQNEPLLLGKTLTPAALAWGLRCDRDYCLALATTRETPIPVFAVDLEPRESPFPTPWVDLAPPEGAPRTTGVVTLASGQPFIDVAAAHVGATMIVATMTNAARDKNGSEPSSDRGAEIVVRPFDVDGRPVDAPRTFSSRAVPVGRVAMATAASPRQEAAMAWVARVGGGHGQVHVARVDGHGRRVKEVELTRTKGDASHVAIAAAGEGWVVAWVDTRDGNGEVYTSRVDGNLDPMGQEQRVTHAPGDAADVSLGTLGDVTWLAWSDPRESPNEGLGDIYCARLRSRDGKRIGDEVRVLATAAHSRSPSIAGAGPGVAILAWIEDAPTGVEGPGAAMFARLDDQGHVVASPRALALGGVGRPTTISLSASTRGVQAAVARAAYDGIVLDGFTFAANKEPGPVWPLVDLDAPAAFDVSLALADGTVIYDDIGAAPGKHRVRRATVAWEPR